MDRRLHPAKIALVGVAAVWGPTFVMVRDAIAQAPPLAFLAYRFLSAALVVGVVFRGPLRALPRAGWLAGTRMGVFLTAGYVFQTFGLANTSAANAGFIHRRRGARAAAARPRPLPESRACAAW